MARIVEAEIRSLRERDFVMAARMVGLTDRHIMFRELLPNAIGPIVVAATLTVAHAILLESYISFLGYGIQPPLPSWGNMLNNAQQYLATAPVARHRPRHRDHARRHQLQLHRRRPARRARCAQRPQLSGAEMGKFSPFDATLWFATAPPAPRHTRLEGQSETDVCIVGAGYTGLTTGLELARKGVRVAVLEAEEAGFGGSGRNAGHCTPTFTHYSLSGLRRLLGEPWAERLIQRQTRANDKVGNYVRHYQMQCEWQQNGYVQAAYPAADRYDRGEGARLQCSRREDPFRRRAEVEAITGSPRFYGGWFHTEGGHLNPLAYARGLARAFIQEGGVLHTASRVLDVERAARDGWSAPRMEAYSSTR